MTSLSAAGPETKGSASLDDAFRGLVTAFESFRDTNDRRLAEIERRGGADVLTEEKLTRIDRALDLQQARLDRLAAEAARPPLGAAAAQVGPANAPEHRAALLHYLRAGGEGGLKALEAKAMATTTGSDGGFLVTPGIDAEIGRRLTALSPVRSLATVRQVSTATFRKPYRLAGPATGWVAETAPRPETASPTLAELAYPTLELYAMPAATQTLLDDAAVDLEGWIAEEVELAFALQEGDAFINGDGTTRPRGILDYPTVAEGAWTWGSLGTVATGTSAAFPATNPGDVLIELVYALKAGYRQNASFLMNRRTQAAIRRFKDANGAYLWQPPATPGARPQLLGFPVAEVEEMPNLAADSLSVAFGDLRRGYLVVDRQGTRILRDPYSAKPYVLFYVTRRVGGGVQDFDAIKLLKFGTA